MDIENIHRILFFLISRSHLFISSEMRKSFKYMSRLSCEATSVERAAFEQTGYIALVMKLFGNQNQLAFTYPIASRSVPRYGNSYPREEKMVDLIPFL